MPVTGPCLGVYGFLNFSRLSRKLARYNPVELLSSNSTGFFYYIETYMTHNTMSKKYVLGNSEAGAMELFPERKIREVQLGNTKICVVRIESSFFAFEALCPHRLASLSEGTVTPFNELVCPLHHYRFDLQTGTIRSGDCRDLHCYPAELTSSGLVIDA